MQYFQRRNRRILFVVLFTVLSMTAGISLLPMVVATPSCVEGRITINGRTFTCREIRTVRGIEAARQRILANCAQYVKK